MKQTFAVIAVCALLTGCSAFKVRVPSASLTINPKTGNVTWTSPKDTKLVNLKVEVATNGTFTASVESWEDLLNPSNITASANGQVDIIKATSDGVAAGINAAASAVGAATAATAKTAIKP